MIRAIANDHGIVPYTVQSEYDPENMTTGESKSESDTAVQMIWFWSGNYIIISRNFE